MKSLRTGKAIVVSDLLNLRKKHLKSQTKNTITERDFWKMSRPTKWLEEEKMEPTKEDAASEEYINKKLEAVKAAKTVEELVVILNQIYDDGFQDGIDEPSEHETDAPAWKEDMMDR